MFCIHCGKQINDGSAFCTVCGQSQQPVGQAATAMAVSAVAPVVPVVPLASTSLMQFDASNSGVFAHIQQTFLSNPEFAGSTKIFSGFFTDVAISESGYIGLSRPHVSPGVSKFGLIKVKLPERSAYFEMFHISQINDIDIDVDATTETSVSGGAGGALVGGLLGGTMGSIIGSAATSGKVKERTTVNGIDLVLDVNDFQNPRRIIPLWRPFSTSTDEGYPQSLEIEVEKQCGADPSEGPDWINIATKRYGGAMKVSSLASRLKREYYNDGEPPVEAVEAMSAALKQMIHAYADAQAVNVAAPQLSAADELVKFKGLLDSGVITQEEFDAKKKQLLGL